MTRTVRSPAGAGGIKSVAKVLDILEYLAGAGRPVGASEVARAVGFHVSTTHRLLRTLAMRGYVDQHAALRSFVIGPQLHALGSAYAGGAGLVQIARPELEVLRDALGETIHLGIFRSGEVIEVASAGSLQAVSVSLGAGRRDPAHCTALGKVLLAALDDAELAAFLRRPLERRTPRSLVNEMRRAPHARGQQRRRDRPCLPPSFEDAHTASRTRKRRRDVRCLDGVVSRARLLAQQLAVGASDSDRARLQLVLSHRSCETTPSRHRTSRRRFLVLEAV